MPDAVPLLLFDIARRGAAVAECSPGDNCTWCKNTAVSRRAQRGDFVAHEMMRLGAIAEQFDGKIRERSAVFRFLRGLSRIVLQ